MNNIYKDIPNVLKGNVRISSVTITTATVASLSISSMTVSSFTATNATITTNLTIPNGITNTDAAAFGQLAVFQIKMASTTTPTATTATTYQNTGLSGYITPSSSAHRILIMVTGSAQCTNINADGLYARIFNGSTGLNTDPQSDVAGGGTATGVRIPAGYNWIDSPASTSTQNYLFKIRTTGGACTASFVNTGTGVMIMEEIL